MFEETSLSLKPGPSDDTVPPPALKSYGPGILGCSYELCAGIVDKKVSLQQSAREEILEETGETTASKRIVTFIQHAVGMLL